MRNIPPHPQIKPPPGRYIAYHDAATGEVFCMHGELECQGNGHQACVREHAPAARNHDWFVPFLTCGLEPGLAAFRREGVATCLNRVSAAAAAGGRGGGRGPARPAQWQEGRRPLSCRWPWTASHARASTRTWPGPHTLHPTPPRPTAPQLNVTGPPRAAMDQCIAGPEAMALAARSGDLARARGIKLSCSVAVEGALRCVRDGGQW
jgi:hypothetical protein